MENQITDTTKQIAVTTDPAALEQLQARLTQYRTIYSNLVTSYEQIRLAEEQTSTNVVVSEPANVVLIPVNPRRMLNTVLAVAAGMLLAARRVLRTFSLISVVSAVIGAQIVLPTLGSDRMLSI